MTNLKCLRVSDAFHRLKYLLDNKKYQKFIIDREIYYHDLNTTSKEEAKGGSKNLSKDHVVVNVPRLQKLVSVADLQRPELGSARKVND